MPTYPERCAQAAVKWRLMWRLAPRLLESWAETGRLNAINAAVSAATKKVCSSTGIAWTPEADPKTPRARSTVVGLSFTPCRQQFDDNQLPLRSSWSVSRHAVLDVERCPLCRTLTLTCMVPLYLQLEVIVRRGPRMPLPYATARAALWFINDLPAVVEALVFPGNLHVPVCGTVLL